MKWIFRQLRDDETDYELVFGVLFVPLYLVVVTILALVPAGRALTCGFHRITRVPCPTCGAFRSIFSLASGRILEAWLTQPMIMSLTFLGLLYSLYSYIVVIGHLPRLRFENVPRRIRLGLFLGLAVLFLANWVYLVIDGR